jgi:hypothetical protein
MERISVIISSGFNRFAASALSHVFHRLRILPLLLSTRQRRNDTEDSAMIARCCILSFRLALLLLVGVVEASAQKAASEKPFERFDGCVLSPDEWTDGDSFRVRLPDGRLETFRLYFVDTTESRSRGKRSDEQAAYFGLTRAGATKLGEEAKAFTAAASPDYRQNFGRFTFGRRPERRASL